MAAAVTSDARWRLEVHTDAEDPRRQLIDDARNGLLSAPRWISSKYFYDDAGCALYDQITELPEYYPARTEIEILHRCLAGIIDRYQPAELVELGAGASPKTRVLLDAMGGSGRAVHYIPLDVAAPALRRASSALCADYPRLTIHAIAADFTQHLDVVPSPTSGTGRLVAFLGGTFGNIAPSQQRAFLNGIAALLGPGDAALIGVDPATDPERTRRAYDDASGVTAQFNRNILHVMNRDLNADFPIHEFGHVARWVPEAHRVEMRLRADAEMVVHIGALACDIAIAAGEEILTEICGKFARTQIDAIAGEAGLEVCEWHTDPDELFALSVVRRIPAS